MTATDPALEGEPARPRSQRRRRKRRIARLIVLLLIVAAGLLALDAARSARVMLSQIKLARSSLDNGVESVVVGDTNGGPPQLQQAIAEATKVVDASNRPGMQLLSLLPVVGSNIKATRAVATAIQDSAAAGLTLSDAAKILEWNNILIPGARSIGDVDLAKIEAATPKIDQVAAQLNAALDQLRAASSSRLLGPVATGYRDVTTALIRRAALATDMKAVFHLLPTFLGSGGPRRYLVAVQSLAIPQASGGTITSVGVLTANNGRLRMGPLTAAPADISTETYPDVPGDALVILKEARLEGFGRLQGLLLTDSVGLADMLWMSGPAGTLTTDTAVATLERQLYLGTNAAAAATAQAGSDAQVLRGFLSHRPSVEAFATGMAQALSERHLYIWMTDQTSNDLLSQLGATGKFQPASFTVEFSSTGDNRTGYYLRPSASSTVILDAGGAAAISTSVRVTNVAPKGPASLMLGRGATLGIWDGTATVYLPTGAAIAGMTTSRGVKAAQATVGDWHVANGRFKLKSGTVSTFQVGYHQAGAATRAGPTWTYRLVILPQPSISPMPVHVSIKIPDGMKIVAKANRLTDAHGALTYDGNPSAALTLWVSYR